MFELTPRLVFAIIFVTGLAALMYWDRKNVKRQFILFYRRTDKGLEFIDRVANRFPRFWKVYGAAGVVVGLLSLVLITGLTGYIFMDMFTNQAIDDGFAVVLPGLETPETGTGMSEPTSGAIFVPIEYWVIAIGLLMFVHEMSHAVVARTEGFEINSVGWIVLGILPGAFVEPKGENMLPGGEAQETESHTIWEGGDWKSRLKVLCAGSWANYLTAGILLVALMGVTTAISDIATEQTGFINYEAEEGYPAYEAGMTEGELYSINGENISTEQELRDALSIEPGDQVTLETSEGTFTLEAVEREGFEGGYIGIRFTDTVWKESYEPYQGAAQWFTSLLFVVAMLNLFIGMFNMLPIKPLDGGLTVETLITEFLGEEKVTYLNKFSLLGWVLILGTILLSLLGV